MPVFVFVTREKLKMNRAAYVLLIVFTVCSFASVSRQASADEGTVVSGTVIAIDPVNQVMRVYVTGVNGQALYGSPQTNYVDYLVSPNTVVVGTNNQFVSQSNVLVGSQIQMQFAGAFATTVVLIGNSIAVGLVNYTSPNPSYVSTNVVSYSPVQSFSKAFQQISRQNVSPHVISHPVYHTNATLNHVQHLQHENHSKHWHIGIPSHAHATTAHATTTHSPAIHAR